MERPLPKQWELGSVFVINLFSGPRRPMDLADSLQVLGEEIGLQIIVMNVDPRVDPSYDIMDDSLFGWLLMQCASGRAVGIHSGTPCSTWMKT